MPEQPEEKIRPPLIVDTPPQPAGDYAELHVTSNFSFLRGGSHPEEMVAQAKQAGCRAVAITDINTLAGIVRGHIAAKELSMPYIVGCHLQVKAATGVLAVGAPEIPPCFRFWFIQARAKPTAASAGCLPWENAALKKDSAI